jgi:hypothetical protein
MPRLKTEAELLIHAIRALMMSSLVLCAGSIWAAASNETTCNVNADFAVGRERQMLRCNAISAE